MNDVWTVRAKWKLLFIPQLNTGCSVLSQVMFYSKLKRELCVLPFELISSYSFSKINILFPIKPNSKLSI